MCQVGDQLELTCNTSNTLHTWQFIAIPESVSAITYMQTVSLVGSSGVSLASSRALYPLFNVARRKEGRPGMRNHVKRVIVIENDVK